jgi:hypothetical protein
MRDRAVISSVCANRVDVAEGRRRQGVRPGWLVLTVPHEMLGGHDRLGVNHARPIAESFSVQ